MGTWVIKDEADYRRAHEAIQAKFNRLAVHMSSVMVQTIVDCLVSTLRKSVARTPVDEGNLRKSAFVEINGVKVARGLEDGTVNFTATYTPGDGQTAKYEAVIGYGGNVPGAGDIDLYAFVQHEHMEFNHPKGGQAKFLESAVIEDLESWRQKISDEVRKALREGD